MLTRWVFYAACCDSPDTVAYMQSPWRQTDWVLVKTFNLHVDAEGVCNSFHTLVDGISSAHFSFPVEFAIVQEISNEYYISYQTRVTDNL